MNSIRFAAGTALVLVLGLATATSVFAQEAGVPADEAAASSSDGDIVVTAQKRAERLQDVPIAVTAISGETIQASGIAQSLDLGKVTPGLVSFQAGGFFSPYIRGIGTRALGPGNEPPTASYIDGIYVIDKQGLTQAGFSDVENIQVLRGPQGTLFGRNATAGAILITTKGPTDSFTASVDGTIGTQEKGARIFLSGPIAPTLSFSVAGFYRSQDPFIRNLNPANGAGGKIGKAKNYGVRGKLRWEPTERFSALLAADYVEGHDMSGFNQQAVRGTGLTLGEAAAVAAGIAIPDYRNPLHVYAGDVAGIVNTKGVGQSLTLNWELDAFDIKSITAHRRDHNLTTLDVDSSPLPIIYLDTDSSNNVWQEELTISSKGDSAFSWMVGAYYLRYRDGWDRLDTNLGLAFPYSPAQQATLPAAAGIHISQDVHVRTRSVGVFGEASYDFSPSTSLTLGLRYTDEKLKLDPTDATQTTLSNGAGLTVLPSATFQSVCAATPTCPGLSTSFNKLTYRAVLTQKLGDDAMAYASYNRGFKSGVYNISQVAAVNLTPTRPETVDAFELGLKSEFLDRRLMLNLSVYRNDYQDLQVPVQAPGTVLQRSLNAAKARTSGIEVEVRVRASDNLTLNAGVAKFFEAKYISFPNCSVFQPSAAGGNTQVSGDCSGRRLPITPDTFNAGFDLRIPLGSSSINLNGLFSHSGSYRTGPSASTATLPPLQRRINTLNLSATWRSADDRLSVQAWGRNILDQDDIAQGINATGFGYSTAYARGATYGLTVGFNY